MKSRLMSTAARAAAVAVLVMIVTAGAAYAGVLPAGIGSTVTDIAAGVGLADRAVMSESAVKTESNGTTRTSDTTAKDAPSDETTATTVTGTDGTKDTAERGIPEDVAQVLASVREFRAAAKEWKTCVIDLTRSHADVTEFSECGAAPTPEAFGVTPDLVAGIPEKLQAKVARFVDPIVAKLTCIESNAGNPEGMRACLAAAGSDSPLRRGDEIRERRDGADDRTKDDRRGEREATRDREDRANQGDEPQTRDERQLPADRQPGDRAHTDGRHGSSAEGRGDV